MKPHTHHLNINEKTAAEAFEQIKPELARIQPESYRRIRIDLLGAVAKTIQVADQSATERPLFEETFRKFPMQAITKLKTYALALWQAETEYRRCQVEEEAQQTPPAELVEQCRSTRDELVAAARYVFRSDKKASEVLVDITRSTGYRDLADDLNRLAELFNAHWNQVNGRSEIRKDNLDQAAQLGAKLMNIVSVDRSTALAEWSAIRQQAWTLLHRAYQEVRDGAAYIHRTQPQKLDAYPSLFATTAA
jgi:predicted metal-dependent hydrolase